MLDVLCVCKSGGDYDAEWVRKLRDGVARHYPSRHRFRCLSDIEVPCERVPLQHDWPTWWSKLEMFAKGVITGPTLYIDLDTIIVGAIEVGNLEMDFGMLRNFWNPQMVGSGVMWFSGENVPHKVYEKFAKQPKAYIAHHERNEDGIYLGDQAFIWDTLNREIEQINDYLPGIKSYKLHCRRRLPADARIVCFHGVPKLPSVDADWVRKNWE